MELLSDSRMVYHEAQERINTQRQLGPLLKTGSPLPSSTLARVGRRCLEWR